MTELLNQLIENLREELKEYGELLALLDEQQEQVMARRAEAVLESVARIDAQSLVLKRVRTLREKSQQVLARAAQLPENSGIFVLAQYLPADYRPLLQALVSENNHLLARVQQRARQNHIMLSRSVELMQRFLQSLLPGQGATTYGLQGEVYSHLPTHALYEAVG